MRVIGAVENMSYLVGTGEELFGSGGGQALADEVGVPLLARIPLDPLMREAADEGSPVAEVAPDSEAAVAIAALAEIGRGVPRGRDSQAAHRPLVGSPRGLRLVARPASASRRCRSHPNLGPRSSISTERSSPARARSLSRDGFARRGLIGRRQLVKAALAQLVFARFGAGQSRVGQTADSAMSVLRGLPVTLMREIAAESWEPVLKPLVYREALERADEHRARGERVYIASAALQEVVEEISSQLGFRRERSPRGPRCATATYTGRLERRLYGTAKADALRELAADRGDRPRELDRLLRLATPTSRSSRPSAIRSR